MTVAPDLPPPAAWPFKLEQKQGLRLRRGDVFVLDGRRQAVVGFDGRDEAYLCWREDSGGCFDTTQYFCVDRARAHSAPCDIEAQGAAVPLLPALDHTGRVASCTSTK